MELVQLPWGTWPQPKPKLAHDLPEAPELSEDEFQALDRKAAESRAAVAAGTESLERLSAKDLRIRLR